MIFLQLKVPLQTNMCLSPCFSALRRMMHVHGFTFIVESELFLCAH